MKNLFALSLIFSTFLCTHAQHHFYSLSSAYAALEPDSVYYIYASHEELTEVPEDINQFTNLQTLNLSYNHITTLPSSMVDLKRLNQLYISNNKLSSFPEVIVKLDSLNSLDLKANQISELPAEIEQLDQLFYLNLDSNKLSSLPATFVELRNLYEISITNNQLTELPEAMGNLHQLEHLSIDSNQISVLPASIGEIETLQWITANQNNLSYIPEDIVQLPELYMLECGGNPSLAITPKLKELQKVFTKELLKEEWKKAEWITVYNKPEGKINFKGLEIVGEPLIMSYGSIDVGERYANAIFQVRKKKKVALFSFSGYYLYPFDIPELGKKMGSELTQITPFIIDSLEVTEDLVPKIEAFGKTLTHVPEDYYPYFDELYFFQLHSKKNTYIFPISKKNNEGFGWAGFQEFAPDDRDVLIPQINSIDFNVWYSEFVPFEHEGAWYFYSYWYPSSLEIYSYLGRYSSLDEMKQFIKTDYENLWLEELSYEELMLYRLDKAYPNQTLNAIAMDEGNGDGVFRAQDSASGKWGMFQYYGDYHYEEHGDSSFVELIPIAYDSIRDFPFNGNFTMVYNNGKVGVYLAKWTYDDQAKQTVPCIYEDYFKFIAYGGDVYLSVQKNGKWGWVNWLTGEEMSDFEGDSKEDLPYRTYTQEMWFDE